MLKCTSIRALFIILVLAVFGCGEPDSGSGMLSALTSPVLFQGDERTAYRDPAILYHDGLFHLFFTLVEVEADSHIYSYTAYSKSRDLLQWSAPVKITPKDQKLNYCSPGNVIRFNDTWVLCLQTYPRPGYHVREIPRYGDNSARIFTMRSSDLVHWNEPELLRVKGADVPVAEMGRMIDPYLLEDKDEPGKWWCFYKQNGVSMSYSYDLKEWTFFGRTESGENVCVLIEDDEYILFHSPANGIGVKRTNDFKTWHDDPGLITLGQRHWPWAGGRLTAATVLDARKIPGIGKFLMFFHGSGPEDERTMFDNHASIAIAWSDDLNEWHWPAQ
jgi:hypothetical protein